MSVPVNKSTRVACRRNTGSSGLRKAIRPIPTRSLRAFALIVAAVALCACQPTDTPTTASAPVIETSAEAGPGSNPITAARARSTFASLCVATRGSQSGTEAAAAAEGFIKHSSYGTYYHPRDNLSVKLIKGDCSMVFASTAPVAELQKALTSLTSGSPAVRFGPSISLDGAPYYNARIAVR